MKGLSKPVAEDITEQVKLDVPGTGISSDPNYDKYEDPAYIMRRLKMDPSNHLKRDRDAQIRKDQHEFL